MARKKTPIESPLPQEEELPDFPAPESPLLPPEKETSTAPRIRTKDMVQAAIDAGVDKPKAGVEWIRSHFQVEMTTQTFSATKVTLKKKEGSGPPTRMKPPSPISYSSDGPLEAAKMVKELCDRFGAEYVSGLAELFRE